MAAWIAIATLILFIVALTGAALLAQQRRALEQMASGLTAERREVLNLGKLHLIGRATRAPSYIPPTDEVVWRRGMRTLQIEHTVLYHRARPELELTL